MSRVENVQSVHCQWATPNAPGTGKSARAVSAAARWNEIRTGPDVGLMKGMILGLLDGIVFRFFAVRGHLDREGGGEHAERDHGQQKNCSGRQRHGESLDSTFK
jgi:hypothetical protein